MVMRYAIRSSRKRARTTGPADADVDASQPLGTIEVRALPAATLRGLHDLFKRGSLTDVCVEASGREFSAHRVVLASASEYFRGLFEGEFADSASPTHRLPDVDAAAFEAALEFAYSGECRPDGAEQLMVLVEVASRLQMGGLVEAAAQACIRVADASTCLAILGVLDRHSLHAAASSVEAVALRHLREVIGTPQFLTLPRARVEELLGSNGANAHETAIFDALKRWLAANPNERADAEGVARLLSVVRFAQMEEAELAAVEQDSLIRSSVSTCLVLANAYKAKAFGTGPPPRDRGMAWHTIGTPQGKVKVDGHVVTIKKDACCVVPLGILLSSESPVSEFCIKLHEDNANHLNATSGFGFVDLSCHKWRDPNEGAIPGLWWLRRFQGRVYNNDKFVGKESDLAFPIGAEVRMRIDMSIGSATFYVNGTEVRQKVDGLKGSVRPCVLSYSRSQDLKFEVKSWNDRVEAK
jgi:hypothetical protein